MAAEHWFRWHHGCVTDPKFRVIALRCVTSVTVGHVLAVWASMLEYASQASPRGQIEGWDDEDCATLLGFATEQVCAIRNAMQGKTLNGNTLIAWNKRQPKRNDDSKDRVRNFREKQRDVTQSNAEKRTVTLETETETEKKDAPDGELFPDVPETVIRDFKKLRNKLRAPITETAAAGIRREAEKAGITVEAALRMCCERGWRGFKAEWVMQSQPTPPTAGTPRKRRELGT